MALFLFVKYYTRKRRKKINLSVTPFEPGAFVSTFQKFGYSQKNHESHPTAINSTTPTRGRAKCDMFTWPLVAEKCRNFRLPLHPHVHRRKHVYQQVK